MRYFGLLRVYWSLSARAALPLGTPLFFGIAVVAGIVFGPTGMRAADLVFTMRSSRGFASIIWFAWLILTFPVARLALVPPSSLYLRWLPAPRAILYTSAATSTLLVEFPLMFLFAIGENALSGFTAGLSALALHSAGTTRPYGWRHLLVLVLWSISVFVPQRGAAFVGAVLAAVISVKQAIDRAPEVHALARGKTRVHAPALAIAYAHVHYVFRKEFAVVGRTIILAGLAGLSLPLAARGFELETPAEIGALVWGLSGIALTPALSGMSGAIIRSEQLMAWLADVLGTSATIRVAGAALAMAMLGCGAGVCLGTIALVFLQGSSAAIFARLLVLPVLWAIGTGALLTVYAREAAASPKRGDRSMVAAIVFVILGIISAVQWGERSLVLICCMVIVGLSIAPKRLERWRRRRGIS